VARTRRRAATASCRHASSETVEDFGHVPERHGEDVVEDEGHALGRAQGVEDDGERGGDRIVEADLVGRIGRADAATGPQCGVGEGFGQPRSDVALRRARADPSMSKQMRVTTVIIHAEGVLISLRAVAVSRHQRVNASWTASAASLDEPRSR
jgi:hypothetical protein